MPKRCAIKPMAKQLRYRVAALAAVGVLAGAQVALAHPGHATPHGNPWTDGLLHPFTGFDHLLAVVAVGLLAVRVGSPRGFCLVPALYLGILTGEAILATTGGRLPVATWGVAVSVIVLGLIVGAASRPSFGAAAVLVSLSAVLHGCAHAANIGSVALLPHLVGMLVGTATLLAVVIGGGLLTRRIEQPQLVRYAGTGVATTCAMILLMG